MGCWMDYNNSNCRDGVLCYLCDVGGNMIRIHVAIKQKDSDGTHRYHHLFTTEVASIFSAADVLAIFQDRFPIPAFNITATRWEETGVQMNVDSIIEDYGV